MIYCGDALKVLKSLPDRSVNCCVTSPPYWGLRDYGMDGQIGLEQSIHEHIDKLVEVFREVRRVLRDDGTLWVNLGDMYSGSGKGRNSDGTHSGGGKQGTHRGSIAGLLNPLKSDLRPKNLLCVPWRLAFALQDDGWNLRKDIIWHKPNAMPESVKDRPTKAHEYVFLLSKKPKYYYDNEAIKEEAVYAPESKECSFERESGKMTTLEIPGQKNTQHRTGRKSKKRGEFNSKYQGTGYQESFRAIVPMRNSRSVWDIPTQPTKEAHFATFPDELAARCIKAGCPDGGIVLDPFLGSGTTYAVANGLGRQAIGIELNPEYVEIARGKIGMFVEVIA